MATKPVTVRIIVPATKQVIDLLAPPVNAAMPKITFSTVLYPLLEQKSAMGFDSGSTA